MSGSIYQAEMYCADCTEAIKLEIAREIKEGDNDIPNLLKMDLRNLTLENIVLVLDRTPQEFYDSDVYPKDFCGSGGESDTPQHCGSGQNCLNPEILEDGSKVGHFFRNPLTSDGENYVKSLIQEDVEGGYSDGVAIQLWSKFYDHLRITV